jgi:isomerase DpgB
VTRAVGKGSLVNLPTIEATIETTEFDTDLVVRIDGSAALSPDTVRALTGLCDQAEDRASDPTGSGVALVLVSGTPGGLWLHGLDVALVNKWERAVRRLERLGVTTVAVASGDCGGPALDALLATDYRVAGHGVRLVVPVQGGATWPGMAVYRLAQQAGVARIRRAVLFGIPIGATEALDLHLVDELAEEPSTATAELVGNLSGPELAIRRQLMLDATSTSFEEALGTHLAACDRALRNAGPEAIA